MAVPSVNLTIDRGTDFEATFTVTNSDGSAFALNGYSASAKIRKHPAASVYKSFTTSMTTATGEIKITMSAANTSGLLEGRNYYDVIITQTSTSKITKVFEGTAILTNTVSI